MPASGALVAAGADAAGDAGVVAAAFFVAVCALFAADAFLFLFLLLDRDLLPPPLPLPPERAAAGNPGMLAAGRRPGT